MPRLTEIDDLLRREHVDLAPDDKCWALLEYTARQGFGHSQTNDLIQNLKKPMDRKGKPEWLYKEKAVVTVAAELRAALNVSWLRVATLVPMPPSRHVGDPGYDDRMERILKGLACNEKFDIRLLLRQRENTAVAHLALKTGEARPSTADLISVLEVNDVFALPAPTTVGLFDDVLTKGTHFRAAKQVLQKRFGQNLTVVGIFVARAVFLDSHDGDHESS